MNGAATKYTFTISFSTPQENNAILYISPPSVLVIQPAGLDCATDGAVLLADVPCSINGAGVLQVTMTCKNVAACPNGYIPANLNLVISVLKIVNPFSFFPSAPLGFYTKTANAQYDISQYSLTNVVVTNNVVGAITGVTMT
jgi:hypothetical protein